MIAFDNEEEMREYVNRWVDEQPAEDLRATITDLVMAAFVRVHDDEALVSLDPSLELESDFIADTVNTLRCLLEVDEMLIHATHGIIAEPGSRYEEDQPEADRDGGGGDDQPGSEKEVGS